VSGVTIVAACRSVWRPSRYARAARPASVVIGQPQSLAPQLPAQEAILGHQIGNHLLLLAIQPTSQGGEQQLQAETSITAGVYITPENFVGSRPIGPELGHFGLQK
jgi:hypothetical protein